jgi:hypothetical protein
MGLNHNIAMKKTTETIHQGPQGVGLLRDFVRKHSSAREIGSTRAITAQGERFLQLLQEHTMQSYPVSRGVF